MAKDKKSFIAYVDWGNIFKMLTDEEAGRLVKHLFHHAGGSEAELDDRLLKMVFEPIRLQLERDNEKYELVKQKKAEAGRKGGLKSGETRKHNEANEADASTAKQTEANEGDNVTDTDTVNDNVTGTITGKSKSVLLEERKLKFASTLTPFNTQYPRPMLKEFYDYWTEPNKSKTKFKQELQKTWDLKRRLETWAKNDKKFYQWKIK